MQAKKKTVLFLCTGNYYRSRFAEAYFHAVAEKEGLTWCADSRGLALERGAGNVGSMSQAALQALESLDIAPRPVRFPITVLEDDLRSASWIVALKEAEHRPLLAERFPTWADQVEYWHVHDIDFAPPHEALAQIQQEVLSLSTRLRGR